MSERFEFLVEGQIPQETLDKMRKEMEEANGEYDGIFFKIFRRIPERIRNSTVTGTIIDKIGSGDIKYIESLVVRPAFDDNTLVSIDVSAVFVSLYESQQKLAGMFGSKSAKHDIERILKKKAIKEYGLELVS